MRKYRSVIAILGGLLFALGAFLGHYTTRDSEEPRIFTTEKFNEFLDELKQQGQKIAGDPVWALGGLETDSLWHLQPKISEPWEIYITYNQKLIYWSSNQISIDTNLLQDTGSLLVHGKSGWNLVNSVQVGHRTVISVYPIFRPSVGNMKKVSVMDQLPGLPFTLSDRSSSPYKVNDQIIYLIFSKTPTSVWNVRLFFWGGIVLLLLAFFISYTLRWWYQVVFLVTALIIRVLVYKDVIYQTVRSGDWFDPAIYASSFLLPSIGDVVLHLLTALVVFIAIARIARRYRGQIIRPKWLVLLAIFIAVLFLTDLIGSIIRGLILDSSISFDITRLALIDRYTILSVTIIGVSLFILYVFTSRALYLGYKTRPPIGPLLTSFVVAATAFVAFQRIDASAGYGQLIPSVVFVGFLIPSFVLRRIRFWIVAIYLIAVATAYTTFSIQKYHSVKEQGYLELYASKLIANKDLDAENLFLEIEDNLVAEFLKPEDFTSFSTRKDRAEKRLRRLYFSGYLDKYDLKVLNYDSVGNHIDTTNFYDYEYLNEIYNFQSLPTLSHYFYQIKDPAVISGYIAKFENCDLHGHYGNVILLLQPKLIQNSYSFPSLLNRKKETQIIDLSSYSYALYNHHKLVQQNGDYPYSLVFDSTEFSHPSKIEWFGGYRHFVVDQGTSSVIVLSTPDSRVLKTSSTFTFVLLYYFFALAGALLLLMMVQILRIRLLKNTSKSAVLKFARSELRNFITYWGFRQPLLSARMQLAMVALVFLGLLSSVYFTIKYIEYNYSQRARNELLYKLKDVVNQLQNEVNTERKINDAEDRLILINDISNVHKVEANIFDIQGHLLASSESELYSQGVVASQMHPNAYRNIHIDQRSQFIQNEWIRDLEYLSAYVPILNEKRQVVGYLNLPYFTRQRQLDQESSTYAVTLVNVFLLLFLVAFGLAWLVSNRITKPLKLIQEKISRTSLGEKNEMIEWRRNDEIGQLIRQYNKMVMELGESADKLTASEREGAWKEMARQVAHEIKNPLTPMKLNIQHLIRAWEDENPKLDETFHKVTTVLIEQIDSLTRLANEFSSFAQMPQNEFTVCSLNEIVRSVVHLFEKTENVDIESTITDENLEVYLDEEQLKRSLNNIIKNGIQAIPEGKQGLIKVDLVRHRDQGLITITDNGTGIPPEEQSKIFVPNFSTKTSGMGLGLAIARKVLETAGGSIDFTTRHNEGTTFIISIPLHQEEE